MDPADSEQRATGSGLVTWIFVGAVLAAVLALILLGDTNVPAPLGRGAKAPDFSLQRLGGGSEISLADLRGRVVLVNFWATWCKPCEDEMPSMEELYRRLGSKGFELVAVSVDEEVAPVEEFKERMSITFPIALDPSQATSRLYQTTGFPESLLVDREGVVVERYVGPRDWAIYRERIERLVAGG